MRISRVRIQGFRCLADVELVVDDVTTLVGANGAGKSSILRALDWFFNGPRNTPITEDDVFSDAAEDAKRISVEVEFDSLTEADREKLGSKYAPPSVDKVVIWRRWANGEEKITGKARAFSPFEQVRQGDTATERRSRYRLLQQEQADLGLPNAGSDAVVEEAMLAWERENPDRLTEAELPGTNFFGFVGQGVMSGLFDYVLVTADLRANEEVQDSKSAVIGRILERAVDRDVAEAEIAELTTRLAAERGDINDRHFKDQLAEISGDLTNAVRAFTSSREVKVVMDEPELKPQRPQFRISIVDHATETRVDRQGHGFQRALLISALRLLAQRGAAQGGASVICLAIEEPELFQHPIQAKAFASVLRKLAEDVAQGIQIMYATHSPYFIEPRHFNQIRRVSRPDTGEHTEMPKVEVTSATESGVTLALDGYLDATAVQNQLDSVAIGRLQEAFFAQAVVLVEGETDQAVIEGAADRSNPLFLDGIVVADVGGKNNLLLPWAILTALKIPCYVVADGDKRCGDRMRSQQKPDAAIAQAETHHKNANSTLLRLFSEQVQDWPPTFAGAKIAFFEDTLEELLDVEWPDWKIKHDEIVDASLGTPRKHASIYRDASAKAVASPPEAIAEILEKVRVRGHGPL